MSETLKPCPNPWLPGVNPDLRPCDGDPIILYASCQYAVACHKCGTGSPWRQTKAEAITAWNTREFHAPGCVKGDDAYAFVDVPELAPVCQPCRVEELEKASERLCNWLLKRAAEEKYFDRDLQILVMRAAYHLPAKVQG